MRSCKESYTTPSTAPCLALPTETGDPKNRCEALALENQCILGIAAEAKELQRNLADRKKAEAMKKMLQKVEGGNALPRRTRE